MEKPIPDFDGVGASSVALPAESWPTVLAFLVAKFPSIDAETWQARFKRGLVLDESGAPLTADAPYRAGSRLYYYREVGPEPEVPFKAEVLHQDEHLLVMDKPHFLQVMPAGRYVQQTLVVRLQKQFPGLAPMALHRLDRGTAGVVLFSVNPASRAQYQDLFRSRGMHKVYEALAPALPAEQFPQTRRTRLAPGEPFFCMREVDGAPNTETHIELVETRGALSLYRLRPITGKKHQLRVHLAALGAPILNDPLYPVVQPEQPDDYARPLKLLARELSFTDPLDGQPRCFTSQRLLLKAGLDAGAQNFSPRPTGESRYPV